MRSADHVGVIQYGLKHCGFNRNSMTMLTVHNALALEYCLLNIVSVGVAPFASPQFCSLDCQYIDLLQEVHNLLSPSAKERNVKGLPLWPDLHGEPRMVGLRSCILAC